MPQIPPLPTRKRHVHFVMHGSRNGSFDNITESRVSLVHHCAYKPMLPSSFRLIDHPHSLHLSSLSQNMLRYTAPLLLLCAVVHVAVSITDGLLPNGNFEQGPSPSHLQGTKVTSRNAIPNWQISGFVEYIKSGQKQDDMILPVPEGAFAVRLGNEACIKQTVSELRPGAFYSITFSAARTCAQEERLNVSVGGEYGVLPMQTTYSSNGWDSYAWGFEAAAKAADLVIHNPGKEEDPGCGPLIDSVAISTLTRPRLTNKNLLKNADFEEGPYILPKTSWGVLISPNIEDRHAPLPAWIIESLKAVKYIDSDHFSVPSGRRAVELVGGRESAIAQIVRTTPGKMYLLTFSVGDAANSCEGSMVVDAYAAKGIARVDYESKGLGGFKRGVLSFRAVETRTRVVFLSSNYHSTIDGSMCGPVVDDVLLVTAHHHRRLRV